MIRLTRMTRTLLFVLLLAAPASGQGWTTGTYRGFDATPKTKLVSVDRSVESVSADTTPDGHRLAFSADKHTLNLLKRNAQNTFWEWARPAAYHAAAVSVRCSHGQGGSGILVKTSAPGRFILVTNAHVVREDIGPNSYGPPVQTVQATTSKGQEVTGRFIVATEPITLGGQDVALYEVRGNNLVGVPLYSGNPPDGAMVEVLAFGGPKFGSFRPYVGPLVKTQEPIAVGAASISGDSGSGILYQGALVGVNYGTDHEVQQAAGINGMNAIPLCYPASSGASPEFLTQYLNQVCGPLGCPPEIYGGQPYGGQPYGGQQPPQQQFPGPEQFYPPPGWENQPIQQPPASQPVVQQPPAQGCDCEQGAPGPPGETGPTGPAGPAGKDGAPGTVTEEHLAMVINGVYAKVKADPDMKGEKGERGEQGLPGKDAEIDLDALAALVADKLPPIRMVIADGANRKIVEDEKYDFAKGEPIVLDIKTIVDAAKAR